MDLALDPFLPLQGFLHGRVQAPLADPARAQQVELAPVRLPDLGEAQQVELALRQEHALP
jgi:hypothetical protein